MLGVEMMDADDQRKEALEELRKLRAQGATIDEPVKDTELEWLRLSFLEFADDPFVLGQAIAALDGRYIDPVEVDLSSLVVEDGSLKISLEINLYAEPLEIEQELRAHVMGIVRLQQLAFSRNEVPPVLETKQGSRSKKTAIADIEICLRILKLNRNGHSINDIARLIYDDSPGSRTWDTSYRKTYDHLQKALSLCKAAKCGTFPRF